MGAFSWTLVLNLVFLVTKTVMKIHPECMDTHMGIDLHAIKRVIYCLLLLTFTWA